MAELLSPKEWFEQVYIKQDVVWGTNTFSDKFAIQLIEEYVDYIKARLFNEKDLIDFTTFCHNSAVIEYAYGIGITGSWELRGEQKIVTTQELLELFKQQLTSIQTTQSQEAK